MRQHHPYSTSIRMQVKEDGPQITLIVLRDPSIICWTVLFRLTLERVVKERLKGSLMQSTAKQNVSREDNIISKYKSC